VLVTFNRLRMLRECLTSLLDQTPRPAFEVIVWDNASDDGTSAYLDELAARNPVLRIVHSPSNIGVNGVARGVKLARGFFIVELDDDVVSFPPDWLYRMVEAFKRVPRAGYLAANVVQDEKTNGARYLTETYIPHDYGDGVVIEEGPTGGWCTITSLETLRDIGNFKRLRGRIYFGEDGDFAGRCLLSGRVVGLVRDVVVYHAAGPLLNQEYGCLDVCEQKYADGREYADILEETRRLGAT
jgi:GT2 family glycosyltransferase